MQRLLYAIKYLPPAQRGALLAVAAAFWGLPFAGGTPRCTAFLALAALLCARPAPPLYTPLPLPTRGFTLLAALLRAFWPHSVLGTAQVLHLPAVFVCNHSVFYGPIAAWLFLPFAKRPWVLGSLLSESSAAAQLEKGFFARVRLPESLKVFFMRRWAPVLAHGLRQVRPLPVTRGINRTLPALLHESVEVLLRGESLLIFPEDPRKVPQGRYPTCGVGELYGGFLHLARLYHARTGRVLPFYPMYACRRRRTLSIGRALKADPSLPFRQEKERLRTALRSSILALAAKQEGKTP